VGKECCYLPFHDADAWDWTADGADGGLLWWVLLDNKNRVYLDYFRNSTVFFLNFAYYRIVDKVV